jgi:type I restriction enzyme S subunit
MPRGSVLFSSRAPIGYLSIAKGDICTNQGFKSVVPTYAGTAYVYYWLRENTDAIESHASGSTFKEASGSLMKSFPALVPEKSVLDSFEEEIAPILNEQEILEEQIYHAEQIRDSLLPRLMSGELVMNC